MREENPRLFWRSRRGNPVNAFYFAESRRLPEAGEVEGVLVRHARLRRDRALRRALRARARHPGGLTHERRRRLDSRRRPCAAAHVRAGAAGLAHAPACARPRTTASCGALVHERAASRRTCDAYVASRAREAGAGRRSCRSWCATPRGEVVGTTRYYDARRRQPPRLRSATPGTRTSVQRTALNTEAKLLLLGACLRNAALRVGRVPQTSWFNQRFARGHRAPGRQAGRRAAQPRAPCATARCATP